MEFNREGVQGHSAVSGPRAARGPLQAAVALGAVAAAAWALLLFQQGAMETRAAPFLGAWTVMMTAMMLPSVWPLTVVYRRAARDAGGSAALVSGYLFVWVATGIVALAVVRAVDVVMLRPAAVGTIVALAGVYELTALKAACLRRCRTPFDFLVQRWRRGRRGALRLGIEHGTYCVGCCWGLMAVLVGAAAMAPAWAALIAVAVFVQKVLPPGDLVGRTLGVAMVVGGAAYGIAG